MEFEVQVARFKGPFDLLLYFIRRDEVDIQDIPIAQITNEFLAYIQKMKLLNIEIAGEFILVAATLMSIKAKMLLPRRELDEHGEEIDPRQDLVARLLEYKKYKSVLEELHTLERRRQAMVSRGNIDEELKTLHEKNSIYEELSSVDLYKLLKTFHKVLDKFEDRENAPEHVVVQYPYTIAGQRNKLLERFKSRAKIDFEEILSTAESKVQVVFTFLAILELIHQSLLNIVIGEGFNNFWLERQNKEASV